MSFLPVAVVAATLAGDGPAGAGPCTAQIAQVEQQIHRAETNPLDGPTAPQTLGAQLHRQPTPATIENGERRAHARADAVLARAQKANAKGNLAACRQALNAAKDLYGTF